MNVISKEAVKKLQLPPTKRPKPYRVAWVYDYSILVTRQCIVPIKLGSYEDCVKRDVIPMNVVHILFVSLGSNALRSLLTMRITHRLLNGMDSEFSWNPWRLHLHHHKLPLLHLLTSLLCANLKLNGKSKVWCMLWLQTNWQDQRRHKVIYSPNGTAIA